MSSNADILLVTSTEAESRAVLEVADESTGRPSRSLEVGNGTYRDLGKVNEKGVWLPSLTAENPAEVARLHFAALSPGKLWL